MRGFLGVSLLLVSIVVSGSLAGCGGCGDDGKGNQLPDAPPLVDAPPDMMLQPPAVTLTVTNLGAPAAGVHVYFVNADDTLVKTVDTDASGNASAVMAAGGSVTAINPFAGQVGVSPTPKGKSGDELRSFLGVKPGDHLFLTNPDHQFIQFQVNAQPVEGANTYDFITSCGTSQLVPGGGGGGSGSQDPGGVVQLEDCQGGADIAIVARNQNADTNTLLQGLYHPDATVMADHTLDLTGDDFVSLVNVSLTFSNSPDATMTASHAPIGKHGLLAPFSADAGGGTVTLVEPGVPGVTKAVVDLRVSLNSQHEVVDWGAYTLTYMLDMDNLLLPEFTDGPSLDVATDKVKWTEASTGQAPDLTTVQLRIQRSEPTFRTWHWSLAAPHSATGELKLPVLPADVFDWTPNDADNISTNSLTNAKVPGGYDAIRAHIFDIIEQGNFGDYVVGDSGRALLVTATPPR